MIPILERGDGGKTIVVGCFHFDKILFFLNFFVFCCIFVKKQLNKKEKCTIIKPYFR